MRIILSMLLYATSNISLAASIDVKSLIAQLDDMWRGDSSHAVLQMTIETERYTRQLQLEAWSKGTEKSLFVIRSPIKDKGIATLKVGQNIWNYLPKINRTVKVPSSMMAASWMGSHFSNDDLIRENRYDEEYDSAISFEGQRNGKNIIELSSTPKPDAPVVWSKVVTEFQASDLTPLKVLYYDEDGKVSRTMEFDQFRKVNGKKVPHITRMIPSDKPNESTTIEYKKLELNKQIKDRLFTLQSLTKKH